MGAPLNNRFWELRGRSGRKKIFETPDELWTQACEYFDWCVDNPLIEVDFKGKDAEQVELPKMRAFTWAGLEFYLGVSDLKNYRTKPAYKDFFPVLRSIEQVIWEQKFTGGAAGLLNPILVSRELGLADRMDVKNENKNTNINTNLNAELTREEALLIADMLEKEVTTKAVRKEAEAQEDPEDYEL